MTEEHSDAVTIPDPRTEPFITVQHAARLLKVHSRTAQRLVLDGVMPAVKVGAQYRIPSARFLADFGLAAPADAA